MLETLGARGFLRAVSGFGQVLKSDPRDLWPFYGFLRKR